MSALDSTSTRWRHRESGDRLVAIAVNQTGDVRMVLPVHAGLVAHPLDWMPEVSFLREYEPVETA